MLQEEKVVNETEQPEIGSEDMTRTLPDEILEHVLSFLPAQEAVQTCVVAKRWCHLWKSMPALRIVSKEWLDEQGVKKLNMFIESLLLKRNSNALIDVCEVEIDEYIDIEDNPLVDQLVHDALLCQARIIRITVFSDFNQVDLGGPAFISQHLTLLELTQVELHDYVLDFSSCPALKNLLMSGCSIWNRKISSQSLNELTISNCTFYPDVGRAQISTPSLIRLEFVDCYCATPMLEGMPSLTKATIRLHGSQDVCGKEEFGGTCSTVICHNCGTVSSEDFNRHCILMKGLSEAESLELIAEPGAFIFKRDLLWCPTFSKLKTLVLNEWCVAIDSRPLICILQHAPVLETLILKLNKAPDNWDEMEGSYDPSAQPLACKKLKLVEIHYNELDRRVRNVIRIMKSHSNFEEVNGYSFRQ